jgi:hypothetical protein
MKFSPLSKEKQMSKEDEAFNDWAWLKEGEPLGYYNGPDAAKIAWRAAVAWKQAEDVAAVERVRNRIQDRARKTADYEHAASLDCAVEKLGIALAAIRGDEGGKGGER